MPDGKVIYSHVVDSFMKHVIVRNALLIPMSGELRKLGIQADRATDATLESWVALLELTARHLAPTEARDDALRRVGREMLKGYTQGMVGGALAIAIRLQGPRRMLTRTAESYRTADNITEVTPIERGPRHFELVFNVTWGVPTYVQGILQQVLELAGAPSASVTYVVEPEGRTVFTVTW